MTQQQEVCVDCGPAGGLDVNCPECGSAKFEFAEGCSICRDCGFSPCK